MAFSCGLALVILSLVFVPVKGAQPNPCGENFLAVASTGEIRRSYLNIVNRRLSTTLCRKPLLDCFREKYLACASQACLVAGFSHTVLPCLWSSQCWAHIQTFCPQRSSTKSTPS